MDNFNKVLNQFEPMIHACLRKLRIYKNHDAFIQAGRIGLWQAWKRYDKTKGDFAPFAYRCIYGSLLDELKKATTEELLMPAEDQTLELLLNQPVLGSENWEQLSEAVSRLQPHEQQLIHLLYMIGSSQDEVAKHLGITKAGVKKRRERTLAKLKQLMTT
ncbi:sigma-70 family RNA polymerase sigma factor [Paenisporosarcina sp. FSL H8-0542]|uniref:sigma-70 family RNA polymerase sigma factor n=1 Tax=Paenisporosarcina sp. FSL H8-0542 TaxID=2921401 RepID=UPI00315A9A56